MNTQMTNNENTAATTVEIRVLLSDLWRGVVKFGWIAVVLAVVLGGVQFYRSYIRFTPVYNASATFTVHTENAVLSGNNGVSAYSFFYDRDTADQLATVFPYVISSPILTQKVCDDIGVKSMPATVTATCVTGTNMITLKTTGSDPQQTYDVLMSVIENYSSVSDYIIGRTRLVMISEPEVPTSPSNTLQWRSSVLKGAIIGAVLGFAWICLYAILRKTVRTKEDIQEVLNQRCVGVLPQVVFKKYRRKINTDIILTNPLIGNEFLESLRLLRSAVRGGLDNDEKVIMVTSTAPDEGKSVITLNLASVFVKNELRVLVVDCDLRNSGIEAVIKNGYETETAKSTSGRFSIRHVFSLGFDLLSFNEGIDSLQKTMRTNELNKLFAELKEKYDLILVDTPPSGMISDATIVAGAADAILYVIRQDSVIQSSIRSAINTLLETDAKFLGCVLNGAAGGFGGYGSYYSYGGYHNYYRKYGYGYHSKRSGRKRKTKYR